MIVSRVEFVLSKLSSARPAGENQWQARCPAHDDRKASLSIGVGDDGKVLLKCQAGCPTEGVCKALSIGLRDLFPATDKPARKRIVATYGYRADNGNLLYQTVRYVPKGFRQRRPDGNGGWVWNLNGTKRVLYNLPAITKADRSKLVIVVEGERDADRLIKLGVLATTCPMGAGKWSKVDASPLHGRPVAILGDNDDTGREHQRDVANSLHGEAAEVKVVTLPDIGPKQDVSNWLDNGHALNELIALVWETPAYQPNPKQGPPKGDDADASDDRKPPDSDRRPQSSGQPKQADILIDLCRAHATFWHSPGIDGEPFLSTEIRGHTEHWSLGSRRFKRWLGRLFCDATGKAPNSQAMQDAIGVLCGLALYDGDDHTTHIRIAECGDTMFLDLADDNWQAVAITRSGWQVINDPPVKFLRAGGMSPLPRPNPAGNVDVLRDYLNVACEDDFILIVGYLVAAFRPRGPYPVLALYGEQGSAKSTTSRVIRSLIDPNKAELRTVPREERDLLISASRSWLLAFDNLSGLRPWLSDALCRLASGGGFSARRLYTDSDEIIINVQKPLLVNGIEELSSRPDLLDRCITVTLPRIPESRRMTESKFWSGFNRARPDILGGLLHAVSLAMDKFDTTHLDAPPRMADAATWVTAAEDALPWESGRFVSVYARNREASHVGSIEASPVGPAILKLATDKSVWHGRPSDLLTAISTDQYSRDEDRRSRDWPKSPTGIGNTMRLIAPALRACGLAIDFGFETDKKSRFIHIEKDRQRVSEVSGVSVIPSSEPESEIGADTLGHLPGTRTDAECPAETGISEPESPSADTSDTLDTQMRAQSMRGQHDGNGRETVHI